MGSLVQPAAAPPPPPPPLEPSLLPHLRDALGCLYSLPRYTDRHLPREGGGGGAAAAAADDRAAAATRRSAHEAEAHAFLLGFRGRNVRRRMESREQSRRDGRGGGGGRRGTADSEDDDDDDDERSNGPSDDGSGGGGDVGSAWLASLHLLCAADAHGSERLFAAQTLLHRLRRFKLVEAVDAEVEGGWVGMSTGELRALYAEWAGRAHPLLRSVIGRCDVRAAGSDEARTKGELALPTLAAATYLSARDSVRDPSGGGGGGDGSPGPMLSTPGSALAVAALRLKFASAASPGPAPGDPTPPLAEIVARSVTAAADAAEAESRGSDPAANAAASARAACACLGSVPDSILGSPGGARGRLSVDPRSVRAASLEMRDPSTGVEPLARALVSCGATADGGMHGHVLAACERWARFVPLPPEFVEQTAPLAGRYLGRSSSPPARRSAFAYLISIFDGASMTLEQVLAASVGMSPDPNSGAHQLGRRKASSKSKKRRKERLRSAVREGDAAEARGAEAEAELARRGDAACLAAVLAWGGMRSAAEEALAGADGDGDGDDDEDDAADGEGPLGCVCACASACLPHLLRGGGAAASGSEAAALFASVMEVLRRVCASPSRAARALSHAPIAAVHAALTGAENSGPGSPPPEIQNVAIDSIYECAMALATSCGYPAGYFDNLAADNDEDLENERNDVRDVLRSVSDLGRLESFRIDGPSASIRILERILGACTVAVSSQRRNDGSPSTALPPETAVHALSALAKPLNRLAEITVCNTNVGNAPALLAAALRGLGDVCEDLLCAFRHSSPLPLLIPISRLGCLATASFSPLFSSIIAASASGSGHKLDKSLLMECRRTMSLSIHAAIMSTIRIPELAAASSLGQTVYDIRGAMRGPGGEDHVGCIALMRLASESDILARTMVAPRALDGSDSVIADLCHAHDELKRAELSRGPGVHHGNGVAPRSRRVLLGTISRLSLLALEGDHGRPAAELEGIRARLHELFRGPVEIIVRSSSSPDMHSAEKYFRICEAAFDLASFSSSVASSLFSEESHRHDPLLQEGARSIVEYTVSGYNFITSVSNVPDGNCMQWGRLRGGTYMLIRACANPGFSPLLVQAITALNRAECEAIATQHNMGPRSPNPVFHDSVVGDDVLPAGAYVMVVGEVLDCIWSAVSGAGQLTEQQVRDASEGCVRALHQSRESVLGAVTNTSPEPDGHTDPRPTLAEAWFLSMTSLLSVLRALSESVYANKMTGMLAMESCSAATQLLLARGSEKKCRGRRAGNDAAVWRAGMSLDGPQTFAILDFMEALFSAGPEIMELSYWHYQEMLQPDTPNVPTALFGGAVIVAALFRGSSFVLPPWAIECTPSLYSSFFAACSRDCDQFCRVLGIAIELRFGEGAARKSAMFGQLQAGDKLAGKYFEGISQSAKETFLSQARDICIKDDANSWRRFKVILKQACGGKKKASSFNLKPSATNWECERI